jgi:N-dimethylarginine dimethylaminohydrolase
VLHLMSFIAPVAGDLAVAFPPLAPVAPMQTLADRGVTVVPLDAGEYEAMACNVPAVRPRQEIMLEGNPVTGVRWSGTTMRCTVATARRSR